MCPTAMGEENALSSSSSHEPGGDRESKWADPSRAVDDVLYGCLLPVMSRAICPPLEDHVHIKYG